MKILFLLSIGFDRQGPSVHLIQSIIRACLKRGHKVHIILRNTGGKNSDVPEEFALNMNFTYDVIKTKQVAKSNFIFRYIDEVKYSYKAKNIYKNLKQIDVAFVQSTTVTFFQTRLLKKILRCPILYNVQDIFPQNLMYIGSLKMNSLKYKLMNYLQKKGYDYAERIVTISPDMLETLVKIGVNRKKLSYIYNWSYSDEEIDIKCDDNEFIKKIKMDEEKLNVIYAGNIGRMQNVEIIISAAKLLCTKKDIHFYIIGDGVYKDKLMSCCRENKNITFLPLQPSEMAEQIYSAADVNIIPLAKGIINTALPSKTATCLRVKKSVVFCIGKTSEFARIVSDIPGVYVVNSDKEKELAELIYKLYKKKNEKQNRELSGTFIERFSSKVNPFKYVDVLEEISNFNVK